MTAWLFVLMMRWKPYMETVFYSAALSRLRPYKMAPDPPSVAILWLNYYRDILRTIAQDVSIDYRRIY